MTRSLCAICLMLVTFGGIGGAQTTNSAVSSGTQLTQAQAKSLAKQASSPAQYRMLADYYANQQKGYLAKASEEKQEWARRSSNIVLTAAKYPRPVDSAHNLYDYYIYKSTEAGQFASKFGQLAGPQSPTVTK
jgi:hypothetical protein